MPALLLLLLLPPPTAQIFGLRKIAKKMLRNFVASVQQYRKTVPRVEVFAMLGGLTTNPSGDPCRFGGLLPYRFGEYVRPILRRLFTTKGVKITHALGNGHQAVLVPHKDFVQCALKPLVHVPAQHPAKTTFNMRLAQLCADADAASRAVAGKRLDGHEARMVLDFDHAVSLLAPLWDAEDEYRRAKLSLRSVVRVQRCARKLLAAIGKKSASTFASARAIETGAQPAEDAAEPSRPAQKLQEARALDAAAGGGD